MRNHRYVLVDGHGYQLTSIANKGHFAIPQGVITTTLTRLFKHFFASAIEDIVAIVFKVRSFLCICNNISYTCNTTSQVHAGKTSLTGASYKISF